MYAFYADESGFSKANKYEPEQPVLVVAGILIDFSKLQKALNVFDEILLDVNAKLSKPVRELKFSEIRNKEPFRTDLPKVEERADLLESILLGFQEEIDFKIFYCAIDNQEYYRVKRSEAILRNNLTHPYLCAAYKILSQLELCQTPKKRNKGKTFVVLDEQNQYQEKIETLIQQPLHLQTFEQIFDTAYFGKSHYSKIIQIADLIAGTIRYYFVRTNVGKTPADDHWTKRIEGIIQKIVPDIIRKNCFTGELRDVYAKIELNIKSKPR
ncbi:MAG TPA: DUF3800 domain-containing protein [Saprospiraceae bacterium]|nr:DUF3800 domain-containing protein [Saprospiraceae bacterium]